MKEKIRKLLSESLPAVDFDSDFLFAEIDSLGVATILLVLSAEFGIKLDASDATPANLRSLDALTAMVESKINVR